jgi:hypothetical protein
MKCEGIRIDLYCVKAHSSARTGIFITPVAFLIEGEVMAQFSAASSESTLPPYGEQAGGHESHLPAGYSDRLYNEDLAPLKQQTWGAYNIFAF